MKTREIVITLAACLTVLVATFVTTFVISQAHRYDVVAVGAGSGGSQESTGSTEFKAYLVDHKTGKIWYLMNDGTTTIEIPPSQRLTCKSLNEHFVESEYGCESK